MEVRFEKNIITGEEIEVIVKANRLGYVRIIGVNSK